MTTEGLLVEAPLTQSEGTPKINADSEEKEHHEIGNIVTQLKTIARASYLNILLIFIPFGIVSHLVGWSPSLVFTLNFLAIIPLAKILGFATEEICFRTSQTVGGLLNATFGNAVELIVAIAALKENLVTVVQSTLLGSILSNLLLVMGICFLAGGYNVKFQEFNETAAQASAGLLAISCMSFIIPAAFVATAGTNEVLAVSHGTAFVLLMIYVAYLVFQLRTHKNSFQDEGCDDDEEPSLSLFIAISLLLVDTILVAVCAEFLIDALSEVSQAWGLSKTFIGLILLPVVGNAAEHLTAVTAAVKNKMNLAISVAVGSSLQIALFVTPLLVVIGWIINVEMTLYFSAFETTIMFVSILVVNYLIADGKSTWLEGVMLLATYIVVAIAVFYIP